MKTSQGMSAHSMLTLTVQMHSKPLLKPRYSGLGLKPGAQNLNSEGDLTHQIHAESLFSELFSTDQNHHLLLWIQFIHPYVSPDQGPFSTAPRAD